MNQPDALYPGLSGNACVMRVTGSEPYNLTVSTRAGPCLVITPDGELQMPGITPSEAAELLIDMFGRSYQSKLLIAEARALAAENLNRTLERRVKDAEDKANAVETLAKRGVVDVLAMNPKSNRSRWFAKRQQDDLSSDKARQDATSDDKDWDDDDKPG